MGKWTQMIAEVKTEHQQLQKPTTQFMAQKQLLILWENYLHLLYLLQGPFAKHPYVRNRESHIGPIEDIWAEHHRRPKCWK